MFVPVQREAGNRTLFAKKFFVILEFGWTEKQSLTLNHKTMKQLLFVVALMLVATAGFSQATATAAPAPKADMAIASFDGLSFDFGKIKQGVPATHEFKFTNTGNVPLIITNVAPSCGCTTPDWSRDPILPGGQGFIKATYNASAVGNFNKTVSVTANVDGGAIQLIIKGEVQPPATPQR
jgi:hypothetical protein